MQNLFLFPSDDEDEENKKKQDARTPVVGELEIMIARPEAQGQGLAHEALQAFIWYISTSLPAILEEYTHQDEAKESTLSYLRVKIDQENKRSLSLFEKLGFKHSSGPNYFGEMELRTSVSDARGVNGNNTMANVEKLPYVTL